MPLLGILLVCLSSRGHQLVFSYPTQPDKQVVPSSGSAANRNNRSSSRLSASSNLADFTESSSPPPPKPRNEDEEVKETFLDFPPTFLADMLSPKVALCDKKFQISIDGITFVGQPALLNADRPGHGAKFTRAIRRKQAMESDGSNPQLATRPLASPNPANLAVAGDGSKSTLTMFNLVLALKPCPTEDFNAEINDVYNQVICKLTSALKYEQLKRDYVRNEARLIMSIREEAALKGQTCMNSFVPTILVRSSLARTLATVFDAISKSCAVRVLVNNSIDVALQVSTNYASPLDELRPYKTLLLLYDADQIIASFPKDCSPLLPVLVRAVSPVDSFERIAAILDINLHMVYRLTSHLVYWKKARVIQSISNRNIYVASPNAQISNCPDPSILSIFSSPIPLSGHISNSSITIPTLIEYLRKDLLIQLHMYLYLVIPNEKTLNLPSAREALESRLKMLKLSESQEEASEKQEVRDKALDTFMRCTRYMNGKHCVEEIMHLESISRKEMKGILTRWRDSIVTVLH